MKKRYKVLIIIGCVIVVLVAAGAIAFSVIGNNLEALNAVAVEDIEISSATDGTYIGSCNAFPVTAEVSVTIKDHVITDIEIISHGHGPGHGAHKITGEVVKAQSLYVDAVSGATMSSKAMLLAIEDALEKGK